MIQAVDHALTLLQTAFEARRLYSGDHAVARARTQAALEAVARCAAAHPDALAALLPDRVVVGDDALPSGPNLARGGLARLRARGISALQFHAPPSADELESLLRCMEDADLPIPPLSGLIPRTAAAAGDAPRAPRAPGAPRAEADMPAAASRLRAVIDPIGERGHVETEQLTTLACELAELIVTSGEVLIPLSGLRGHDEYTYVHTLNVAMLSGALAQAAGLSPDKVHEITCAAMLHDVGKSRVPLALLNKHGKLDDAELAVMRRHPVEGARILIAADIKLDIAVAVAYEHHMQRSGGGYPKPPPGWRMHAASQIVQVADVFDALRTNRPYRAALSVAQAREVMQKDVGRIYEPDLLETFFTRVATRTSRDAA